MRRFLSLACIGAVGALGIATTATAIAVGTASAAPVSTTEGPEGLGGEVTDPALLDELADASPGERVVVEVVTDDTDAARAAAKRLGGVITGSVPDEVVQVSIAASRVDELAATDDASGVRRPLVANRPVTGAIDSIDSIDAATRTEFGPVSGENITITNARRGTTPASPAQASASASSTSSTSACGTSPNTARTRAPPDVSSASTARDRGSARPPAPPVRSTASLWPRS